MSEMELIILLILVGIGYLIFKEYRIEQGEKRDIELSKKLDEFESLAQEKYNLILQMSVDESKATNKELAKEFKKIIDELKKEAEKTKEKYLRIKIRATERSFEETTELAEWWYLYTNLIIGIYSHYFYNYPVDRSKLDMENSNKSISEEKIKMEEINRRFNLVLQKT